MLSILSTPKQTPGCPPSPVQASPQPPTRHSTWMSNKHLSCSSSRSPQHPNPLPPPPHSPHPRLAAFSFLMLRPKALEASRIPLPLLSTGKLCCSNLKGDPESDRHPHPWPGPHHFSSGSLQKPPNWSPCSHFFTPAPRCSQHSRQSLPVQICHWIAPLWLTLPDGSCVTLRKSQGMTGHPGLFARIPSSPPCTLLSLTVLQRPPLGYQLRQAGVCHGDHLQSPGLKTERGASHSSFMCMRVSREGYAALSSLVTMSGTSGASRASRQGEGNMESLAGSSILRKWHASLHSYPTGQSRLHSWA